MEIKDKIIGISFYFLFQSHVCWNLSVFAIIIRVLNGDSIKSDQIGAIIRFQLLNIHEEGFKFANSNILILVEQERAVVDAGFMHFIASLIIAYGIEFS